MPERGIHLHELRGASESHREDERAPFIRFSYAFSTNLECAVALRFMHYTFGRKHQSLDGKTPGKAAGVADHAQSVEETAGLLNTLANPKLQAEVLPQSGCRCRDLPRLVH